MTNSRTRSAKGDGAEDQGAAQDGTALPSDKPVLSLDSAVFKDVTVALTAKLGEVSLSIEELLALKSGSSVTLDTKTNGLVELYLNQNLVARGEVVAVEDNFGIRIVEIAGA